MLLLVLGLGLAARSARAQVPEQECATDPLRPLEVSPASGAVNASIDAPVVVRYAAGYFGPDGPGDPPSMLFQLVTCGSCGASCALEDGMGVSGLVQTQGDSLLFLPDGGLTTQTAYVGRAIGVDGELDFSFCTGSSRDAIAPSPVVLAEPTSAAVGSLPCLPEGGYRIGAFFQPATDDGPPGSIEYLLFQTRGEGIDAPVLVDRVRNFQTDGGNITMSFLLPGSGAVTPICLQVVTIDGAGHASVPDGDRCFDPVGRVTFQGCAAGTRESRSAGVAALVVLAALVLRRARRPR